MSVKRKPEEFPGSNFRTRVLLFPLPFSLRSLPSFLLIHTLIFSFLYFPPSISLPLFPFLYFPSYFPPCLLTLSLFKSSTHISFAFFLLNWYYVFQGKKYCPSNISLNENLARSSLVDILAMDTHIWIRELSTKDILSLATCNKLIFFTLCPAISFNIYILSITSSLASHIYVLWAICFDTFDTFDIVDIYWH